MPRTTRLADKRPDQWLIDQTTFFPWAVEAASELQLAERNAAEVWALAREIAAKPFEQYA